jgi:hypothetical protein
VLDAPNETQERMPEVITLRADISGGAGSTGRARRAEALLQKKKNAPARVAVSALSQG